MICCILGKIFDTLEIELPLPLMRYPAVSLMSLDYIWKRTWPDGIVDL